MAFDQRKSSVSSDVGKNRVGGNASFLGSSKLSAFYFELVHEVESLELDDVGVAPAADARAFDVFKERVRLGYCAGMSYLTEHVEARRSPRSILPDARSLIVVALSESRLRDESRVATDALFNAPELQPTRAPCATRYGSVSGYATCLDYHDVLRKRLKALGRFLHSRFPQASVRTAVDCAPLLEKYWAVEAGLGFCGLNSLTIHPRLGSRFFLGELVTSIPFEDLCGVSTTEEYFKSLNEERIKRGERVFDKTQAMTTCLSCRRCVDACPTNALPGDRTLDARRCLNYWTIENRDEIPDDIARLLDGKLFGCDLCQRVCPHNAQVEAANPRELPLDAVERLDEDAFRRLFKKTPIFRAHVEGLKRVAEKLQRSGDSDQK